MSDTPRTDQFDLPEYDGGEALQFLRAEARDMERELAAVTNKCAALTTALSFAQGAISDAIYTEDGLDGDTGQRILAITHEAIECGTFDQRAYEELACMDAASQLIDALENLSAVTAERDALRQDAERYRILRAQFSAMSANIDGNHAWAWRGNPNRLRGSSMDDALDALRRP